MSFDFKFSDKFKSSLTQDMIDDAYDDVTIQFAGVISLWASLDEEIRDNKRSLCLNYLVGWYLADLYPLYLKNIASSGGMPISSKSIGGTSINYSEIPVQEGLKQLTTNMFGLKALQLIQSCPERFGVYR